MECKEMETEDSCTSSSISDAIQESDHDHRSSLSHEQFLMRRSRRRPETTRYHQHHHHHAATRLQKVYKSFRTRRQLADCAVLAEQRWWKVLDFAELKRSSISFFDIHHSESAASRWSRARTKAAKVGKGLSKDEKARKLALQHWLEAIDPRHRYGHNLQFYYVTWLRCESRQPFFFWLDIGGGREVNIDRCPRSKLYQQCIKYLGPVERLAYEVVINDAKFVHKETEELLDTTKGPKDAKWIFVLSTSKTLYVGQKNKGTFQHSSFLAGGATLSAGRLVVEQGVLKAIWPHSGHYLPTEENFQEFISFLMEHNVDLIDVKKSPTEEEEESSNDQGRTSAITDDESSIHGKKNNNENREYRPKLANRIGWKMSKLAIPNREEIVCDIFKPELQNLNNPSTPPDAESQNADDEEEEEDDEGYETAEDSFLTEEDFMVPKITSLDEEDEEDQGEETAEERRPVVVPKENIMVRINSHKGMNTYQLANQLSSKWTTGAGPRIGCMRDYPIEIQFRVLEHAQLSPRATKRRYPLRPLAPRFSGNGDGGGGGGGVVQTPTAASAVSRPILHRRAETAMPAKISVGLDQIETSAD